MHQLFLNLIGNALKFQQEGVAPLVKLHCAKIGNGFWKISIKDNGIGIEEKYFDRIFKPFERLHGKSEYEGTGIGLTICNNIVTRYGGKISAKKNLLNGVTFEFTLSEKQKAPELPSGSSS